MKHLFIPYELALIAKEKGFNEPCLACYDKCDMLSTYTDIFSSKNYNNSAYCKSTPLYQQIIDWFREVHSIEISAPMKRQKDLGVFYGGYICNMEKEFGKSYGSNYKTYYEALNKAIEEAFKLI